MNAYHDESILEENLSSERVFDGLILHIDHLTNRLPNGKTAPREVARHIGASAVLPIDDRGNVLLVRQYRAPIDRVTMEIPAGKLDTADEDPLHCAVRELREETGLKAEHMEKLSHIVTTPGFCTEKIGHRSEPARRSSRRGRISPRDPHPPEGSGAAGHERRVSGREDRAGAAHGVAEAPSFL